LWALLLTNSFEDGFWWNEEADPMFIEMSPTSSFVKQGLEFPEDIIALGFTYIDGSIILPGDMHTVIRSTFFLSLFSKSYDLKDRTFLTTPEFLKPILLMLSEECELIIKLLDTFWFLEKSYLDLDLEIPF
jgi:hypothetical protein